MSVIHNVAQGSEQWLALRAGRPTASAFDQIVTPALKPRTGEMPRTYQCRLIAEQMLGYSMEDFSSYGTDRGEILEREAIPWYELTSGETVRKVGFVTAHDGAVGCSPDALVGDVGGIEVKCAMPVQHVKSLLDEGVPEKYMAQIVGVIWICDLQWLDFVAYSPMLPSVIRRVHRDEAQIEALSSAVLEFAAELERAKRKVGAKIGGAA